jgi:hypothetical protein
MTVRRAIPFELHWSTRRMPLRWVVPDRANRRGLSRPGPNPLNLTERLDLVCRDAVARCPTFAQIDMDRIGVTIAQAKSGHRHGLQARLTPLRLRDGERDTVRRGRRYRVQQFTLDGRELLYLVTFCVPRFLDLPFEEKLLTVFHELYHIGERFDGDFRRHEGRCHIHSSSKKGYDAHMERLVTAYLKDHPDQTSLDWLKDDYRSMWDRHAGLFGAVLPKPRLIPVVD